MSGDDNTVDEGTPAAKKGGPTLTHSQAINRLHDLRTQMGAIAELDNPSDEDDRYFLDLKREFEEVDAHRKNLERQAAMEEVKSTTSNLSVAGYLRSERGAIGGGSQGGRGTYDRDPLLEPDSVEQRRFQDPWDFSAVRTFGRAPEAVATEWRARALSACERMQGASDNVREAATKLIERWDDQDAHLSQLALALSQPQYMRAWSKLARAEGQNVDLSVEERQAVAHVRHVARSVRALSLTDTAGGYLVPFQLDPTVMLTANGSLNEIRRVARQVVAVGDTWHGVNAGAVQWRYVPEVTDSRDDAPTFGQPSIPIYRAEGFVPISIEALMDASNITATVGELLAEGKDVLEAEAFTTGSSAPGTAGAEPVGIVTALTGTPSVVATAGAALAEADIYALQGAMPARYRGRSSWMANNATYAQIRSLALGLDSWGSLSDDRRPSLLGRPVLENEEMAMATASGDPVAIFGDFSNYVIADRIGMTVEFIPHLFSASGRPNGQRGWQAYVRHGADSVNDAAFRMLTLGAAGGTI